MKKSRFSDSQTMAILKQAEAGTPVSVLCREMARHAVSIKGIYIQPDKPWQNAYLERIKRTVRYVWLNNINGRRIDEIAFF
jgi:hypothetical protein